MEKDQILKKSKKSTQAVLSIIGRIQGTSKKWKTRTVSSKSGVPVATPSFTQAIAGVTAKNILRCLDGLPKDDVHCAQLASETLRLSLADYLYKKRSPWKKHYRKI